MFCKSCWILILTLVPFEDKFLSPCDCPDCHKNLKIRSPVPEFGLYEFSFQHTGMCFCLKTCMTEKIPKQPKHWQAFETSWQLHARSRTCSSGDPCPVSKPLPEVRVETFQANPPCALWLTESVRQFSPPSDTTHQQMVITLFYSSAPLGT